MEELPRADWISPDLQKVLDAVPGATTRFVKEYDGENRLAVSFQSLSPQALEAAARHLRERRERVLLRRPVREIAKVLDRVAETWLDPAYAPRREAIPLIARITKFSPEMVVHSMDLEQISSRGPHLLAALENELGDLEYLDHFKFNERLGGHSRAVGPELVGAIFSSNIPALPHLEVMRAFLVKAACLGRVSAGEPIFLSLYARSLAALDPELASCLAVIYWERGDAQAEASFLNSIDYLVAYGGEAQTQRLLATKPPGLEATWHGHKLGFSYLCRENLKPEKLEALADKVAYDFTIHDGHACLCPQVCLVERGGEVSPLEFSQACARAMESWTQRLPPRFQDLSDAANKFRLRELSLMRSSMDEGFQVVAAPESYAFTVVLEETEYFEPSPSERFLRVVPVDGPADLERMIRPLGKRYLQSAAVAAEDGRFNELREVLARWGVSRVVPPGLMGTPSMMWHHDGNPCLGKMLTWCDHELKLPEELLEK
ncbi:MAG TPA: acyl-CoA reductase [bacterium]|nr:acyl-CoA reductase [bacterium]